MPCHPTLQGHLFLIKIHSRITWTMISIKLQLIKLKSLKVLTAITHLRIIIPPNHISILIRPLITMYQSTLKLIETNQFHHIQIWLTPKSSLQWTILLLENCLLEINPDWEAVEVKVEDHIKIWIQITTQTHIRATESLKNQTISLAKQHRTITTEEKEITLSLPATLTNIIRIKAMIMSINPRGLIIIQVPAPVIV